MIVLPRMLFAGTLKVVDAPEIVLLRFDSSVMNGLSVPVTVLKMIPRSTNELKLERSMVFPSKETLLPSCRLENGIPVAPPALSFI